MSAQHVIVTGGAGFIGSHTCKALSRAGFLPVAVDNLSNGRADAVRWGPLETGSLEDAGFLNSVFDRYKPVAVLHFAALIEAGESVKFPGRFYRNNVAGTLALTEAMARAGVDVLILSSTAAVYGDSGGAPIRESNPLSPVNPYGQSKLMAETILGDLAAANGLHFTALRYFNASGADPDGELGENHDPETHLIPLVLRAAFGLRPDIRIFGTDYPTPDGTCIRDYVHVCDLAAAHVLALSRLLDGGGNMALNLGNGQGFSVRDIIRTAMMVTGRPIRVVEQGRRPGDPAILVADASAARDHLGWTPSFPHIRDHIRHAAAWMGRQAADEAVGTPAPWQLGLTAAHAQS
ncbi:UDP-glucose 4-epimerase GalE [Niveispirillum sp.]|uniref:UDP-glucose 4-epimerase GalE n=1 Tax=Niveispirillum sp. TaxID=1917217 RepID=UPI001B5CAD04|nr:UDP-glucose 4-epimerase GalE [Niveispirillum sp.]MBP7338873.1 UDP-glucose 4-epimerase GalE [Niveispirillum sp.]